MMTNYLGMSDLMPRWNERNWSWPKCCSQQDVRLYRFTNGRQTLFFLSFNTIPLLLRVFPKPSTNCQDHFAHNTGPGNTIICGSLIYWLNIVKFPTNLTKTQTHPKNAQIQCFTIYFVKKIVLPLKCFNTFDQIVQNMVWNSSLALSAYTDKTWSE